MNRKRSEQEILADVKRLAVEYYELTDKPLGVTGEIAEVETADKLGLALADARTEGYDALDDGSPPRRVQIKGRRILDLKRRYVGRMPRIDLKKPFDTVALALLDAHYEVFEIWEAERLAVEARLTAAGSKSRNERGALGISQFRSIASLVWQRESEA